MSSSQKVSWFKFILLWFVISKWNFLQSALDWLTLSWTFCFYFEADSHVCWHVFCFNCVGTPWSYLYESSNHNTKYMSAEEILSEKGKIPLMCFSMQGFLQALEAQGACQGWCTLTHFPPVSAYSVPQKTTHRSKTVLPFQRQSVSFGFSTFICRALCLHEGKANPEMKCYKAEVQSRLNFSQVRRCQRFITRFQFWFFFYAAVEKINKTRSS